MKKCKFRVGDKLWRIKPPEGYDGWRIMSVRETVKSISIQDGLIYYSTSRHNVGAVPEDWLFEDWDKGLRACITRTKKYRGW